MIYEFRTYTLKPRTLKEFVNRFGEALPKRLELSPLAAFWHTEIGPLNQVIHVWPYADTAERTRIRAEAMARGIWPPDTSAFIENMQSDIYEPMTSVAPLTPGELGPYYEMRTYVLKPGTGKHMAERWDEYLPERMTHSPLAGAFHSDIGALNRWLHIWPYKSLDDRMAVRKRATEAGTWPPPGDSPVIHQESKIVLPAPFSPMR
ncbi:MAG: NIPSNAP family protein [Pseudomonadota bacterium]